MKKALIFLAEGCEEVEAVTPIDFLRRAGINVVSVGVGGKRITGAHGLEISADMSLPELNASTADGFDALVFPGGMPGASNIASERGVIEMIRSFYEKGRLIAAICASPAVVLAAAGILEGHRATCYPGMESLFGSGTEFCSDRVVEDGNLITSRGPGTAMEFSVKIVERLEGKKASEDLVKSSLMKR